MTEQEIEKNAIKLFDHVTDYFEDKDIYPSDAAVILLTVTIMLRESIKRTNVADLEAEARAHDQKTTL